MEAEILKEMQACPGAFFMLICECTHKESGHELSGECSRCDCKDFRNTTHITCGDTVIV